MKNIVVVLLCVGLAACAGAPRKPEAPPTASVVRPPTPVPSIAGCSGSPYAAAQEDLTKRGDYVAGGLYRPAEKDRVPMSIPDIACIPEPQVVALPRSKLGNNPVYRVLDKEYRVLDDTRGFVDEGLASYYGEKFHGRRTSNWEVYDMYAFSAAHKTLPLPSFARVTNVDNGKTVVVRINDRGPFHDGRVMDLSLAAAVKLGIYPRGTGHVRVEALQPGDPAMGTTFAAAPATRSTPRDSAGATMVTGTPAANRPADYRYDMQPGAASQNPQQFDAWMKQHGVHVATGRPAAVVAETTPAPVDAMADTMASGDPGTLPMAATQAPIVITALPSAPTRAAPAAPSTMAQVADGAIVLQVASFSTRDNADRALSTLRDAGIAEARLLDALANGQPIWRLRVGPLSAAAEPELLARLEGLGFTSPRRVHD